MQTLLFRLGHISLALFPAFLATAHAESITLLPAHDATLIEIAPDRNNGAERWVNAGTTQNGTRNRGLFQWDLSGQIPDDAAILSVNLSLEVTRLPGCGIANSSFSLYRVLRPWGEGNKFAIDNLGGQGDPATSGEVTWLDRFFGIEPWAAPGGMPGIDFESTASATEYIYDIGRSPYRFVSEELTTDVRTWLADPSSNFGWMLISDDEGTPFTARRFGSREDDDHLPLLTIEFEPVPEPGTLTLLATGLGLAALCFWRKRPSGKPIAR